MSNKYKIITISPSGNLYGSENVLFDYLCSTELHHIVFVPKNSQFERKLNTQKLNHIIIGFNPRRIEFFYGYLILFILTKRVKCVYINEAGHFKWILLLAKIFQNNTFIVHVRIIEDVIRISPDLPNNMKIITISNFMMQLFDLNKSLEFVRDPYTFSKKVEFGKSVNTPFRIGVIGRISLNKGIFEIKEFIASILDNVLNKKRPIIFHFYGSESKDEKTQEILNKLRSAYGPSCIFFDFVETELIYKNIDLVLHLARKEPLGRIFFEALNYGIPLVGFKSGGIGELGQITGLDINLIDFENHNWKEQMLFKINDIIDDYESHRENIIRIKQQFFYYFNQKDYNDSINKLIKKNRNI